MESGWNKFLEESFSRESALERNGPEMIVAASTNALTEGFLVSAERNNSHQRMAKTIAPIAFGVQIKVRQCHNNHSAWEIEQAALLGSGGRI